MSAVGLAQRAGGDGRFFPRCRSVGSDLHGFQRHLGLRGREESDSGQRTRPIPGDETAPDCPDDVGDRGPRCVDRGVVAGVGRIAAPSTARASALAANRPTNLFLLEEQRHAWRSGVRQRSHPNGRDYLPRRHCGVIVANRVKGLPPSPFHGSPRQAKSKRGDAPHGDLTL